MKNNLLEKNPSIIMKAEAGKDNNEMQWDDYKDLIEGMTFFDPYIQIDYLTTIDYQAMAEAGVVAIIEPAFRLEQSITGLKAFKNYNGNLAGWDRFRNPQFGIKHYCTVGLNSKDANNERLAEHVMATLPLYLRKEGVVGIGDIGFENQTKAEEKYFRLQLELAKKNKLPIQIRTPHHDKKAATQLSIDICNEHGIDTFMVIMDHNNEDTIKSVIDKGYWASFTNSSSANMGNEKIVEMVKKYGSEKIMIKSTSEFGVPDSLNVPKTAAIMKMNGILDLDIKKVTYQNAIDAFGQSGQIYVGDFQKIKGAEQKNTSTNNDVLSTKRQVQIRKESVSVK